MGGTSIQSVAVVTGVPPDPRSYELKELWQASGAAAWSIPQDEFAATLLRIGEAQRYGAPGSTDIAWEEKLQFLRGLKLTELALAQGCAQGNEAAWERFVADYREPLTRAAIAIARSEGDGRELADSVYAELYGLSARDGARRSPLASYSGRGSLAGWLRTVLAQRHVDRHRRTYRESPLDEKFEVVAPPAEEGASLQELSALGTAVGVALRELGSEERFLLVSYYLERRTLAEIGRVLGVHEASISRRMKRVTGDLRGAILKRLQANGLGRRAAEEALCADPRDLELNVRALLQETPGQPFQKEKAKR